MQPQLQNTIGQSLLAIGLYTVAFESLVLTVKDQMQGYLASNEPTSLKKFYGSLGTANNTLKFCEPRLVQHGVLDTREIELLSRVRQRRNQMAHEGYNNTFTLTISDIEDDVDAMFKIARKVENWRQAIRQPNADGSSSFGVAPSIFGLYLQVAQELARKNLSVAGNASSSA
ncbi:hypothetical protein KIF53_19245 [Chromobacterium subtsugae]|uniref:RiboL-PSP-HEPN domain-containing protein n=1 Tax=Chromobacterium subtsugae TaxID=251747 RepID=A0ABS7FI61_9NEIS|nr:MULTISPECIES: hypothetical protein [Chromobacterium]KUM05059.1 hypothetical protein Cv017_11105 [Chromobacterium subtsugae]KZE85318.1 hypothetical protein AWB61_20595 [Chromobacterium sp. F49]MBW7569028.1 hypothetical protein [Chromobacterium subtsugae]MBW8289776.1 hypothetical protein [Chromobacterium subtsugae]WSE93701.1 hypothetical protein U6115_10810 [Chromobacterium subtsugae]